MNTTTPTPRAAGSLLPLLLLLHLPLLLPAQTIITGGDVSGLWAHDGSPYLVQDNITVPDGATLAIDPGVTVEFQGHFSLFVQGRLLAEGSSADTILFTIHDTTGFHDPASTDGGWYGIRFDNTPLTNDTSRLSHCTLEYGKAVGDAWSLNAGGAICAVNFGKISISHCLFRFNSAGGSYDEAPAGGAIHLAWSGISIKSSTFMHNKARDGGAIQVHESEPVFAGNTFTYNTAEHGGAINFGGPFHLSLNGDTFLQNTASSHGGGLMMWNADTASFANVIFDGNTAEWGGGLGLFGSPVTIDQCSFNNNMALNIGGGVAADFCDLLIQNSTFYNDSSASISGGLHNWHCQTRIKNCDFSLNKAFLGGAIYSDFSTAAIESSNFSGNTAHTGGALRYWCTTLTTDQVLFSDNQAYHEAGAIEFLVDTNEYSGPYEFTLNGTMFSNNSAGYRFGAVHMQQFNSGTPLTTVNLDHCTFTSNHAERVGAVQVNGNVTDVRIANSLFLGNSSETIYGALSIAGGISGRATNTLFAYNDAGTGTAAAIGVVNGSAFQFIHCTFTANTSQLGGAISLRRGSKSVLFNSILWNNSPNQVILNSITDTTPCHVYVFNCDVQDGQDSVILLDTTVSVIHWDTSNLAADPKFLDSLAGDFHLSDYSHCLGRGADSAWIDGMWVRSHSFDQEGHPRPDPAGSRPDLGAYESPLAGPMGTGRPEPPDAAILGISPNPFRGHTTLQFSLLIPSAVSLTAFNTDGKKVLELPPTPYPGGTHQVILDGSGLRSGMYYLRIKAGHTTQVQKVMLIR